MAQIPYIQAQAPEAGPNPLQMAEGYQRLAQQRQQFEQQQLENQAKRALGDLAQQAFDPATGQIDTNKWLSMAAQHPQASLLYPELAKDALQMGLVDAQKHGQMLENNKKELEFTNAAMAGLAGKPEISDGDIAGAMAQLGIRSGRGSKWAMQKFTEYQQAKQNYNLTPAAFVKQALQSSEVGLKALENTGGTFNQLTQMFEAANAEKGVRENITKMEMLRRQGYGMAQGGGVAPPSSGVGQGSQPSTGSPAASREIAPQAGVATTFPLGEETYQAGKAKQWDELRSNVATGAEEATGQQIQLSEMNSLLGQMGYDTGMFSPEKLQLAKTMYALDPEDKFGTLRMIEGATSVEDAVKKIGASEAFDKLALVLKTMATRAGIGPSNKITNKEFEAFQQAFMSLRTSPEGVKKIMDYMDKLNKLAIVRNKFLEEYEISHGKEIKGRDIVKFQKAWGDFVEKRPTLYKFTEDK